VLANILATGLVLFKSIYNLNWVNIKSILKFYFLKDKQIDKKSTIIVKSGVIMSKILIL
jgi:hypothetical protein